MKFPLAQFEQFCSALVLNSKEQGRVRFKWNGAQRRFIEAVVTGLENDTHNFVVLKSRQLGLTTLCLALDLFWLFRHSGLQGALAVPNESVRDLSRAILENYQNGLPDAMKWPATLNNRTEIRFRNESRLAHLIAGGRNSGALARGQGLSFVHATEMSSWADPEGVVSLQASMAENHKKRLYAWESTARGFNIFHDMWRDAENSKSTDAVFIGWWAKEDYRIPKTSRLWNTYGRTNLAREERIWAKEVKRRYGVEIDPEQWAWWRWKWAENAGSKLLLAEYPFTAEQAFVMTGSEFFPSSTLQRIVEGEDCTAGQSWNYRLSQRFEDTEVYPDPEGALTVWEEPQADADYVIAADPAYGESEWADCFCIQVLKCTLRGAEQVAEFNTPDCTMYGFAWILAHLAGSYSGKGRPSTVILELGGPGRGVLQELQRMPAQYAQKIEGLSDRARAEIADIFGSIQHYLYRRPDSLSGGALMQWETTWKTKQIMMNTLRDLLERGMLKVHSREWVEEARYVTQNGTRIAAEGRGKDDRVIAMGLGCMAWQEQLQLQLLARGEVDTTDGMEHNAVARSIGGWLSQLRSEQDERRWQAAGSMSWQD
ncbi:MAG TPA: hypothetical protein VJ833_10030 [Rhodanobacteraceae bacterium]|nr:hypothetical protein [Rhodanobacteraceae bacterium]